MSETPNDTWPSLILEFQARLTPTNGKEQQSISSEDGYRDALTRLCSRYKEHDKQRLQARIRRQHAQVIDFTVASFHSKKKLSELIEHTKPLNGEFPLLNRENLTLWEYEPAVQKPLLQLFREYMECYLSMLSDVATVPTLLNIDHFNKRIENVKQFFSQRTVDWEAALKVAEQEEQRRLLSATTPSSPRDTLSGAMRTHGTNAHFKFVRDLGRGTYGDVSMVMEATSGNFYAQKVIRVRERHNTAAKDKVEQQVKSEVDIMQRLRHHHIASVLFYVKDVSSFSLIMLPVGNYDLRYFLDSVATRGFPEGEIKHLSSWFGSLVSALAYAHDEEIKHEDIKPSNILIKDYRPYLADFGSAKDFSKLESSTSPEEHVAGTPVYYPPERKGRGRAADVFALGCVFSEMLTVRQRSSLLDYRTARYVPDTPDNNGNAFRNNLPGVTKWLKDLKGMDKEDSIQVLILEVVLKMLEEDTDKRYTAKKVKREFRREEDDLLFCPSC